MCTGIDELDEAIPSEIGGGKTGGGGPPPEDSDLQDEFLDRYLEILEGGLEPPPPPPERDLGEETREILQTQIDLAPDIFASEAQYRPKYAALDLGILGFSQPVLDRIQTRSNAVRREANIEDIERLGPRAVDAARSANPNVSRLLDEMSDTAYSDLQRAGELSPDQVREVEQASRAAYNDRGLVRSNPAILDEVTQNFKTRLAMEDRARSYAGDVLGYEKSFVDPALVVTGTPSSSLGFARNTANAGAAGATQFDPYNAYGGNLFSQNAANAQNIYGVNANLASTQFGTRAAGYGDLYNTLYNAEEAYRLAELNNKAALQGAGIDAAGDIIGSVIGLF